MELVDEFAGTWRVIEMAKWSAAERDQVLPAEITFFEDETGHLHFAGMGGSMQCSFSETVDGASFVRFKWAGRDENDGGALDA